MTVESVTLNSDRPEFSKKLSQWRNDRIDNVGTDAIEQKKHLPSVSGGIRDHYKHNRLGIHFHADCVVDDAEGAITGEFCIAFTGVSNAKLNLPNSGIRRRTKIDPSLTANCEQQRAMLIDVLEFLKLPEPLRRSGLPSVIRLQSLHDCARPWTDMLDFPATPGSKSGFGLENGKGRFRGFLIRQARLVSESQCVDEMIERAPEIVETITDNLGNTTWRAIDGLKSSDIISSFSVDLGSDDIRVIFAPTSKLIVQRLQVLTRPL